MKVKTLVILPAILVAMALVLPVSGYQYTFQDELAWFDDWATAGSGAVTRDDINYTDCFGMRSANNAGVYLYTVPLQNPTSYWAFTLLDATSAGGFYIPSSLVWLDASNAEICTMNAGNIKVATRPARYEITRNSSGYYNCYIDGVFTYAIGPYVTLPYNFEFKTGDGVGVFCTVDDVVIGTSEEHDIIGAPPKQWFVAKDVFEPAFSGLYSEPDIQEYGEEMHVSYGNDDGSMTLITLSDLGTGTVWNTTTISGSYAGVITYNLTTMLFTSGAPYGFYSIQSSGTDAYDTFVYKAIATTGTTVVWDDTTYIEDETATITYTISAAHWVTDDYRYYLKILGPDISELESWEITTQPTSVNQTVTVDTTTFPIDGTYYCALYAQDRSSLEDILLVYDDAYFDVTTATGTVEVEGTTYDAINGTALTSCSVTATQLGTPHSTTSNPTDGSYSISALDTSYSIGVNATKTGWVGSPIYFTPYANGSYVVNIPLIPSGGPNQGDWNEDPDGWYTDDSADGSNTTYWNTTLETGVGGICYNEPYWTATGGCSVVLSNASWNATATTGPGGWWQFDETGDGVCGGTYTLTCSKTGYDTLSTPVTCVEDQFNRKDTCLSTNYTLTVHCRELTTHGLISDTDCYVELSTGDSTTCTNGIATFNDVDYGVCSITGSAVGYYPGTTSCVVDGDATETCYLESESQSPTNSTGLGVGYPPKTVRFTTQTIWGAPISDCLVNCTGYETTLGSWDWLYSLFGVDSNETAIATATMGGYTDYKGDIDFVMFEPVKYNCTFNKTGEINKTIEIYPKDDYYIIISTPFGNESAWIGGEDLNEAVTCNVTTSIINPTNANITCNYLDTSGGTTGGTVFLNQTNPLNRTGPEITVASWAIPGSSWNHTFSVTNQAGESYFVRVKPTHSTWDFERDFSVTFPENQVNPLNLTDTELMFIAVFIILFTGLLFGAISAPHAPLIMCFLGWIFLAFGWMDAIALSAMAVLTLASVLAVLNLVMVRSKKERYI